MEKPAAPPPASTIVHEVRAAAVECTPEQCRHLYAELIRRDELPRDIVTLFQNPQEEAPWEEFWRCIEHFGLYLSQKFRALKKEYHVLDQRDLASLRFIVDDNFRGSITKVNLVRFLLWFWPLLSDEDLYETATERTRPTTEGEEDNYVTAHQYDREDAPDDDNDEGAPEALERDDSEGQAEPLKGLGKNSPAAVQRIVGWQISEIAVHFLHKPYARYIRVCAVIVNEKAGTFLLRFSSVPPHFAIDLQDGFRVRHWRIEHRHKERKLSIFKDEYESLQRVVDAHSVSPLKLASGSPSTLLREGLSRAAWDVTLGHGGITPTTAEALLTRSGGGGAVLDSPWPPPADWASNL